MDCEHMSWGAYIPLGGSALVVVNNGPFRFWLPDDFRIFELDPSLWEAVEARGRVVTITREGTLIVVITYTQRDRSAELVVVTRENEHTLTIEQLEALAKVREWLESGADALDFFAAAQS